MKFLLWTAILLLSTTLIWCGLRDSISIIEDQGLMHKIERIKFSAKKDRTQTPKKNSVHTKKTTTSPSNQSKRKRYEKPYQRFKQQEIDSRDNSDETTSFYQPHYAEESPAESYPFYPDRPLPYYESTGNTAPQELAALTQKQIDYKRDVLTRLTSGNTILPTNSDTNLNEKQLSTTSNTLALENELLLDFSETEQVPSATTITTPDNNFNFSSQNTKSINIQSISKNGEVVPYTRFTIENGNGSIILDACTNAVGNYSKELKIFNNDRLYLKFYSSGMNQDKVQINNNGEDQ